MKVSSDMKKCKCSLTLESGEYWKLTGCPAVAWGCGRENTLRAKLVKFCIVCVLKIAKNTLCSDNTLLNMNAVDA